MPSMMASSAAPMDVNRTRDMVALLTGSPHDDSQTGSSFRVFPALLQDRPACCACRQRPGRRRAAEQRDELAAFHSITSSARAESVGGTSMPSAFAVLRL